MKFYSRFAVCLASIAVFLSLCGCGKDKDGMIKVQGGKIPDSLINSLSLNVENSSVEKTESVFSLSVSDFYISRTEVTQQFYNEVMSENSDQKINPSYFNEDPADGESQKLRPVENVTWFDALEFCNRLSVKENLEPVYVLTDVQYHKEGKSIKSADVKADFSKNGYRLPTHAEWLFAACDSDVSLKESAWTDDNASEMTHQVGTKAVSKLGLYDMTGNVAEWVWDSPWSETFECREYKNYHGPDEGSVRIIKGGSFVLLAAGTEFDYEITSQNNAAENFRYYNVGFRIARNAE